VSTGELVEVMAINAIAPAILNARLKPLLEVRCAALANNAARSWNGKRRGGGGGGPARDWADISFTVGYNVSDIASEIIGMYRDAMDCDAMDYGRRSGRLPAPTAAQASPEEWTFIVNVSAMEGKFYRWKTDQVRPPLPARGRKHLCDTPSSIGLDGSGASTG
jgi:hypothetical protein